MDMSHGRNTVFKLPSAKPMARLRASRERNKKVTAVLRVLSLHSISPYVTKATKRELQATFCFLSEFIHYWFCLKWWALSFFSSFFRHYGSGGSKTLISVEFTIALCMKRLKCKFCVSRAELAFEGEMRLYQMRLTTPTRPDLSRSIVALAKCIQEFDAQNLKTWAMGRAVVEDSVCPLAGTTACCGPVMIFRRFSTVRV